MIHTHMNICRIAIGALFLTVLLSPAHAQQPQIFFGTIDTITGRDMHRPDPLAFMEFFKPNAPWQRSASGVTYFDLSTQFIISSTEEQLTTVFDDLKRRNIAVGIQMGASQREPGCGAGEGYMPAAIVDIVGKRLTKHGYKLAYMQMDEPIWFAHEVSWGMENGQTPCHYPLPKLVEQVSLTVHHMRQYFPDLKVGDIEVIADYADRKMDIRAVVDDYVQFSRLFERATGTRLAFFHADIAWRTNWRPTFLLAAKSFRAEGIRFGAVIGGRPIDQTDIAFEQFGLAQLQAFQSNPATRLDDVLIESWQPRPSRFLPETEPGTSAHILLRAEEIVDRSSPPVPCCKK